MRSIKRVGLLVCSIASILISCAMGFLAWIPDMDYYLAQLGPGVVSVLISIVALLSFIAGVYTLVRAIKMFTRKTAQLSSSTDGSISIERSALVSAAKKAASKVPNVVIQSVDVEVIQRKGSAVLDVAIVAAPTGTSDSLMAIAHAIENSVKQSLEAFTEREVRYVAVNFVERKRHLQEDKQEDNKEKSDAITSDKVDNQDNEIKEEQVSNDRPVDDEGQTTSQQSEPELQPQTQQMVYETVVEQPVSLFKKAASKVRHVTKHEEEKQEVIIDTPVQEQRTEANTEVQQVAQAPVDADNEGETAVEDRTTKQEQEQ